MPVKADLHDSSAGQLPMFICSGTRRHSRTWSTAWAVRGTTAGLCRGPTRTWQALPTFAKLPGMANLSAFLCADPYQCRLYCCTCVWQHAPIFADVSLAVTSAQVMSGRQGNIAQGISRVKSTAWLDALPSSMHLSSSSSSSTFVWQCN